jgi:IS5 family transposase
MARRDATEQAPTAGSDDLVGAAAREGRTAEGSVRAEVEHPFHVIKKMFRHKKVRYKGWAKNTAQFYSCSV